MTGRTLRELVTLAVFGALWGVAEMSFGALLHALKFPLTGMAMAAVGMGVALTGYRFVPRRGSVLTIAVVSALLKLLSVGPNVLAPMVAIVAEGVLAEIGLAIAGGGTGRLALALAGALAVLWSFVHPFVTQGLLAGSGMAAVYRRGAIGAARLLHLDPGLVPAVLLVLGCLHLVTGAAAGLAAHALGRRVSRRLDERLA